MGEYCQCPSFCAPLEVKALTQLLHITVAILQKPNHVTVEAEL